MDPSPCSRCGATVAGNFCAHCGTKAGSDGGDRRRRAVVVGALGIGAAVGLGTWSMVRGAGHGGAAHAKTSSGWESDWRAGVNGLKAASAEQKSSNKPMLVYFYADWCGYCRKLEASVLATTEGRSALRDVILVRINAESGREERQLAGELGVRGYPTLILVTPEGGMRRIRTPQSPDELRRVLG